MKALNLWDTSKSKICDVITKVATKRTVQQYLITEWVSLNKEHLIMQKKATQNMKYKEKTQ